MQSCRRSCGLADRTVKVSPCFWQACRSSRDFRFARRAEHPLAVCWPLPFRMTRFGTRL